MIGFNPTIKALGESFQPGSRGGEMTCPSCGQITPDSWKSWNYAPRPNCTNLMTQPKYGFQYGMGFAYMECANLECKQLVVMGHHGHRKPDPLAPEWVTETWMVWPRTGGRPLSIEIPEEFRRDYFEAAALLDISPRMSGVLSRKILGDLLERYAQITNNSLARQIDAFAADPQHPRRLREGLRRNTSALTNARRHLAGCCI